MADTRRPWAVRASAARTATNPFEVMVVGCGLIGGSIARATRGRWTDTTICAVDRPAVLTRARQRKIAQCTVALRAALARIADGVPSAVILALPVDAILEVLPAVADAARRSPRPPLVLDVGSVKTPIVECADAVGCPRFVGGHPMAGNETGGIEASSRSLFEERPFVLCPGRTARPGDVAKARRFVAGLGARPRLMDAREHDRIVALTSHLPHVAAWTLMEVAMAEERNHPRADLPWGLAAGSWRDATRVAASDPRLWTSILHHNGPAIVSVLDAWIGTLQRVRDGLARGSPHVLEGGPDGIDARAIAGQRRRIRSKLPPIPGKPS